MARTIYKYPLTLDPKQTLALPFDAEGLTVQLQNGVPVLWTIVDPDHKLVTLRVYCLPTGGDGPDPRWEYLGTVQLQHDGTVWHFFSS